MHAYVYPPLRNNVGSREAVTSHGGLFEVVAALDALVNISCEKNVQKFFMF